MPDVRVAISDEFLDAFEALPKGQQTKVRRFFTKFRADPTSSGINLEKIRGARDPKLRSVRIDQTYRGIVMKPETVDVYVLLWVDHHDDAYAWARNKVLEIHPSTGSLQVLPLEEGQAPSGAAAADEAAGPSGLYADYRDRELVRLGIPPALMPLVRSIDDETGLDEVQQYLPQEAYEALFLLAAGYTQREVDREMEHLRREREVDTDDYAAALANPDSRRRFKVVTGDDALERMLDAPLEKWRVFLHPSQRRLVTMKANGPVRVLGGAGTGKTVVAMHRAAYLAEQIFPDGQILFTTFTRNLAADIAEGLRSICSPEAFERIEVVNLDAWVARFLNEQGYRFGIDYSGAGNDLWQGALALAPDDPAYTAEFLRGEWDKVIQPNGVTTLSEYMRVRRHGRGQPLRRADRKAIWRVFDEYRTLLDEHRLRERSGAMRDAREILEKAGDILPYDAVIVDEAQDMGRQAFQLIRQIIPGGDRAHDLFLVGDAHQRIYDRQVVLGRCGINIVGRGRKLHVNYRTTEENRKWAVNLLRDAEYDDLDGGVDTQSIYMALMHGDEPQVHVLETFQEEIAAIISWLENLQSDGASLRDLCLVARTSNLLNSYGGALRAAGIETCKVRRSRPEDRTAPGVRLATMHRAKGLEFSGVIIAGVNDGTVPLAAAVRNGDVPVDERQAMKRERSLFYVAATRAKHHVFVTCHGRPSRWLERNGIT